MNPESNDPKETGLLDLLPEYVVGTLPEAETRRVEAALAVSPTLRRELDRVREVLSAAALSLQPVAPADEARRRLFRTLDGPERFAPFLAEIGRVFDLSVDAVKAVLARIDDAGAWVDGLAGVKLIDFAAGPRLGAVDAGLVRLAAGGTFPKHRHLGEEVTIVLEGTLIDGGVLYPPGAVVAHATDTVHDYGAGRDRDLVLAILNRGIAPVL